MLNFKLQSAGMGGGGGSNTSISGPVACTLTDGLCVDNRQLDGKKKPSRDGG